MRSTPATALHPSPPPAPAPRSLPLPRSTLLITIIFLSLPAFVGIGSRYNHPNSLPTGSGDAAPVDMKLHQRLASRDGADVCLRWSHQSTTINDTIYIYGGQAKSSADQTTDTWNNNFLTLDIGSDWAAGSVTLTSLSQPSGPPAVSNGFLWTDNNNIWLYGGEFADNPVQSPTSFSTWQYSISSKKWSDVTKQTSIASGSGSNSIQRAAEGAGVSVKSRGLGYYFGGHLDYLTTEDWSIQTKRVYLKSLLEFDMGNQTYNNRTGGGLESAGVPERADGILSFVPWGPEGILLAIGGGTNSTFSQMNTIDIYDLQTKEWTKQATSGSTPKYRVNPCSIVASAPDATSHQVYMFGGQDLIPTGQQTQYQDMWILTVPSFTWIQVDQTNQSVPAGRSGHSCELAGSQMIVIGGYVGQDLSCDAPGIYVFDASTLQWKTSYSADSSDSSSDSSSSDSSSSGSSSVSTTITASASNVTPGGVYKVPQSVIDIVGGNTDGGATVTRPVAGAQSDSPVGTGGPDDYKYTTITAGHAVTATSTLADGSIITSVTTPTSDAQSNPGSGGGGSGSAANVGGIVGGVVGGISFLVLLLMAVAYYVYRRKLKELRESAAALTEANGHMKEAQDAQNNRPGALRSDSTNELMLQGEPSFWGVLLSPRRSLRVVNH